MKWSSQSRHQSSGSGIPWHHRPTCVRSAQPWAPHSADHTRWLPARSPSKLPRLPGSRSSPRPSPSCLPSRSPPTTSPPTPPAEQHNFPQPTLPDGRRASACLCSQGLVKAPSAWQLLVPVSSRPTQVVRSHKTVLHPHAHAHRSCRCLLLTQV